MTGEPGGGEHQEGRADEGRRIERVHPGFGAALRRDARGALAPMGRKEVPLLFWAAAGWAGAISAGRDDLNLVANPQHMDLIVHKVQDKLAGKEEVIFLPEEYRQN